MKIAIRYTFFPTLLIEVEAILPVHSRLIIGYGNFPAELFRKFVCLLDLSLCFGNVRAPLSLRGNPATTTLGESVFPATLNHR